MAVGVIESGTTGRWDWKRLELGSAWAEVIPGRGGIVTQWEIEERGRRLPLLWLCSGYHDWGLDEPRRLGGGIPILFPTCGPTASAGQEGRYLVGDRPCIMPNHGFAAWMPWEIVEEVAEEDEAAIAVSLKDTPETHKCYPFSFQTIVRYTLRERSLRIGWTCENLSEAPMPIAPGLHPYYRVPFTRKAQRGDMQIITTAQTRFFQDEPVRVWNGKTEPLKSGRIQLGDLPSGRPTTIGDCVTPEYSLVDPASGLTLRATWPASIQPLRPLRPLRPAQNRPAQGRQAQDGPSGEGTGPYLNLWTPDEQTPAYCVEPFLGLQNALNHRRGLIEIAAGNKWEWWFEMEILGAD